MAIPSISPSAAPSDAFGLDFQSLLKIILTQLTYQDPLKPLDNFQFVSQLAQFAQLQQSQNLSDTISATFSTQGATLAVGLLGKTVDARTAGQTTLSGIVQSISFSADQPEFTLRTPDGRTISGLALSLITQVR